MKSVSIFAEYSNNVEEESSTEQLKAALSEIGFFRELADGAPEGIMLHQSHRPIYVNHSWAGLHGMTVNQVMALPTLQDLIHKSDRERNLGYCRLRMAGGKPPVRYRYRALHHSGRSFWLENSFRSSTGAVVDFSRAR